MTRAHVALGSNLGDRLATLDAAVRALDADDHTHVMAVSQVYETEPDGGPGQGPYLNAVAVLETDRDPRSLLDLLLLTEERLGRVRHEHWGPRTADLDLFASFPDGETAAEALVRLGPVSGVVPVGELEA